MTFTQIVGFLSVIAILIFRVIPIYGIVKLFRTGDVRPIPFLLYFSTLVSTTFWTVYGFKIHVWEIWVINGSAVVIMPVYLTLYFFYLPKYSKCARFLLIISLYAFTNLLLFFSFNFLSEDGNGTIASSLSFLVQSSQILTIAQVLSTNNSIYIDIYLVCSFASTNILNTLYGILIGRVYWWLSMSWGLIFNIIQICLYHTVELREDSKIADEYEDDSDISNITDVTDISALSGIDPKNVKQDEVFVQTNSNKSIEEEEESRSEEKSVLSTQNENPQMNKEETIKLKSQ